MLSLYPKLPKAVKLLMMFAEQLSVKAAGMICTFMQISGPVIDAISKVFQVILVHLE